ncbi:GNAT family N-acetyltransferase [Legionella impletisoli]|uniref:N-acetyltransferase n=1 Tax=Legionella impletisoli TaxID=343510 RepID=A0A917JPP7_9GAMM|nr:GNAT family protein [Legionella impletisoli]GGI80037.1 N-acetyltransferase [Legionella impletisoli]
MHGKSISLRPIISEDSDQYFKWINNEELVSYNANYKSVSRAEHQTWFDNIQNKKDLVIFSIIFNENGQLIGSCSLRNINRQHKNAELQIRIGEMNYQNRGLGSEAVRLLVDYGFIEMQLKRIYLYVFSENIRAIKAYEKCAFITEGTLRKAAYIKEKFVDLKIMAIINE